MLSLKPELKGALLAMFGIVIVLVGIWVWMGFRIGLWTYPQYERHVWLLANLPVDDLLWQGKIQAGDKVENLIKDWRPHEINRFGPWTEMSWFPGGPSDDTISFIGTCVIAKNGVLVYASSYSDDGLNDKIFFNAKTSGDDAEFRAAEHAYGENLDAENSLRATDFPIMQALWQEKIKAGDDAEKLIKLWSPRMITRIGPWIVLRWFPENPSPSTLRIFGLRMIAKDGVLVSACNFSDDGHHSSFFDTKTPRDDADLDAAFQKHDEELMAEQKHNANLDQIRSQTNAVSTADRSSH
jgi:hypothetical protein